MSRSLLCGAAKRKITPRQEWMPDLRGLQNVTFTSVLDDIYLRVAAFRSDEKTVLIVTFDLDKAPCPREFIDTISQETGIDEANILFLSIHTHTAPITGWRPDEGQNFIGTKPAHVQKKTHEYEAFLKAELIDAVHEALRALRPARIGWTSGESFVSVNRIQNYTVSDGMGGLDVRCGLGYDPGAAVDNRLFVLKAESIDGEPIAFFVNYAVHNCVMIRNRCGEDGGTAISSDLGGNVSQYIEAEFPGSVALWTSGAAGDINPVISNEIFYPAPKTGAQTAYIIPAGDTAPIIMLKVLAARHYADVLKTIRKITCTTEDASVGGRIGWSRTPGRKPVKQEDGTVKYVFGEEIAPYEIRVHMLYIGALTFFGFSGELYSSLGRAILDALPDGTSVLINHDASLLTRTGYIFDDDTWARDKENALPGHRVSMMLPGYVKESLLQLTSSMLTEKDC